MIMLIEDPAKEKECAITFLADGSYLITRITPGYCAKCRNQVEGFFCIDNARYGQLGTIECNHCGMEIHCTDNEGNQDSIFMIPEIYSEKWSYVGDNHLRSLVEIDFKDVYQINSKTLLKLDKLLQSELGEDNFLAKLDQEEIELLELVEQTCASLNIQELPNEKVMIDERFSNLPEKVNKWLNLLKMLNLI